MINTCLNKCYTLHVNTCLNKCYTSHVNTCLNKSYTSTYPKVVLKLTPSTWYWYRYGDLTLFSREWHNNQGTIYTYSLVVSGN